MVNRLLLKMKLDMKKIVLVILFLGICTTFISVHLAKYSDYGLIDMVLKKKTSQEKAPFLHNHIPNEEYTSDITDLPDTHVIDAPGADKEDESIPTGEKVEKLHRISELPISEKIVIFPKRFDDVEKGSTLSDHYRKYFDKNFDNSEPRHHIVQLAKNDGKPPNNVDYHSKADYHSHAFKIFQSSPTIDDDEGQCEANLLRDVKVDVSKVESLSKSLLQIITKFKKDNSPYYRELEPFWKNEIDNQIKSETVDQHWYRLAGSSVWLEEYGVHFFISRIIYSPSGVRNAPTISLTYAQLFNDQWQELEDSELIVPSNNPDVGNQLVLNDQIFTNMKFPGFLSVPSYHDPTRGKFYGPEDPRIILVRNPKGYDEPLIVFNAYQRKIESSHLVNEDDQKVLEVKFGFYRSMFMCWPWQFQRGKANIDDLVNPDYRHHIYNRLIELRRFNIPRIKNQKNWTPFVSYHERAKNNFDNYIYFIYRWNNLEVLRCDLANVVGESNCQFEYRLNEDLPENDPVGELRGGTQLVNVNELLQQYGKIYPEIAPLLQRFPRNREIWLGFARAHLKNCGCGQDMYRPNMVIITKDVVKRQIEETDYNNKKIIRTVNKNVFKISHLSSFVSFDLPIVGWDVNHKNRVCVNGQPNILIPNGISDWTLQRVSSSDGTNGNDDIRGIQDYLTLSTSSGDSTTDIVHIRGILNELYHYDDTVGNIKANKLFSEVDMADEERPKYEFYTSEYSWNLGFNNDNVKCALKESRAFCSAYGEAHKDS